MILGTQAIFLSFVLGSAILFRRARGARTPARAAAKAVLRKAVVNPPLNQSHFTGERRNAAVCGAQSSIPAGYAHL